MISLVQIAYNSEWALAKFFEALTKVEDRFDLRAVCGIEEDPQVAISSLKNGIRQRLEVLASTTWRNGNRISEVMNAVELMDKISSGKSSYFKVNDNLTLPNAVYELNPEAVVIHSRNAFHLGYIVDAISRGKHVLCEKPIVPILNERGIADDRDLCELEKIVKSNLFLVLMDAEHYSYKGISLVFYDNLDLLRKSGRIKSVRGEIKEIDNPEFGRTREILSCKNRTGLLSDTMCHLFSFISNLNGVITPEGRVWDSYPGYFVDTYNSINGRINNENGDNFVENASFSFSVGKFVDRALNPEKESKNVEFTFEDGSIVLLDLAKGRITKRQEGRERELAFRYRADKNEYVNVLNHFYEAIVNGIEPRTSFKKSLKTLRAVFDFYKMRGDRIKYY